MASPCYSNSLKTPAWHMILELFLINFLIRMFRLPSPEDPEPTASVALVCVCVPLLHLNTAKIVFSGIQDNTVHILTTASKTYGHIAPILHSRKTCSLLNCASNTQNIKALEYLCDLLSIKLLPRVLRSSSQTVVVTWKFINTPA